MTLIKWLFLFDYFSQASRLLSSLNVCLAPLRNTHTCARATCNMQHATQTSNIWRGERNPLALMNEREKKWNIHLLWLWIILTYNGFYEIRKWPLESWCVYSVAPPFLPNLGLRTSQTILPEDFIAIKHSSLNSSHRKLYNIHVVGVFKLRNVSFIQ